LVVIKTSFIELNKKAGRNFIKWGIGANTRLL